MSRKFRVKFVESVSKICRDFDNILRKFLKNVGKGFEKC